MQFATRIEDNHCARCYQPLTFPLVYRADGLYHTHCWQEGEHLLANAERIARALNPALFMALSQITENRKVETRK